MKKYRDSSSFIKARPRACWVCGLPTRYIEINFEAYLHKKRCLKIADRAYWKTTVAGAPDLDGRIANRRLYRFMRRGCKYRGEKARARPMDDPGFSQHTLPME